jgi:hypothetical protein
VSELAVFLFKLEGKLPLFDGCLRLGSFEHFKCIVLPVESLLKLVDLVRQ